MKLDEDVWREMIIPELDGADLARLRRVSKGLLHRMSDEELWTEMLTTLVVEHPVLSDLDRGAEESMLQWYGRCYMAVAGGHSMTLKHKAGGHPFLDLYGTIDGSTFKPFASPVRFLVLRGFLAELISFMKSTGVYADPPKDAALLLPEATASIDSNFRKIHAAVVKLRGLSCPPSNPTYNLDKFSSLLFSNYEPEVKRGTQQEEAAAKPQSRRALDNLQRRLGRAAVALEASEQRVAALEAENLQLREVIKLRDKVIAEQAAEIVDLKSKNRALQSQVAEGSRAVKQLERRPTQEAIEEVASKLHNERMCHRAAKRHIGVLAKERTRLRRMLTCAEKAYREADAALEAAKAAAAGSKSAEAQAQMRLCEAVRDAAAQVALAQAEASQWMEESLDAAVAREVQERGLRTEQETLAEVRRQAQTGEFTAGSQMPHVLRQVL